MNNDTPTPSTPPIPDWFGPSLGAAQHQDRMNTWPRWQRLFHRWFIAHRCPACRYWNGDRTAVLKQRSKP